MLRTIAIILVLASAPAAAQVQASTTEATLARQIDAAPDVVTRSRFLLQLAELYVTERRAAKAGSPQAKVHLLKAVKTFRRLTDGPSPNKLPRMDYALWLYADTLRDAKYSKDAREIYDRLIATFPSSPYSKLATQALSQLPPP
jgi:hypothetical protein